MSNNNLDELHLARESLRKSANKLADTIDDNFKQMKKKEFGKIKYLGIESLSLLTGIAVSGTCKMLDVPIETAFGIGLIAASPNVITSALIPSPNKLSNRINYSTIKYLVGTIKPYANNIYEYYFR